tara:strand:+ start:63 stop:590 length:528 start_codon:yes stop_codon:yes gene_type:complete
VAKNITAKMKDLRIAFTGPESSGKTTMSKWLSEHFSFDFVEEYAREHLSQKTNYNREDLNKIATEQFRRYQASGNMAIDTEMLVMKVWFEEKYNYCSDLILELLERQKLDFYFLCKPDIPWEEDPLRENPLDRDRLFMKYEENLIEQGFDYIVLEGTFIERKEIIIDTLRTKLLR